MAKEESLILREVVVNPNPVPFFESGASIQSSTGTVPFHRHTCPSNKPHPWDCNSPYCTILLELCPDHGGLEPVRVGREPWRGR